MPLVTTLSSLAKAYRRYSTSTLRDVVIAVGSNQGKTFSNFTAALGLLKKHSCQVVRYSRLYETAPAYVLDQPPFLNAAVVVRTSLSPESLLTTLKNVEASLGRQAGGQRWGPRPIDLDIVFYHAPQVLSLDLQEASQQQAAPSESTAQEADVDGLGSTCMGSEPAADEGGGQSIHPALRDQLWDAYRCWNEWKSTSLQGSAAGVQGQGKVDIRCVLPMGKLGCWAWQGRSHIMGILNITPDSFSDGGQITSVQQAVQQARRLAEDGADMLDVGGQSTRPGAAFLSAEDELERVLPVIRALASDEALTGVAISIDTFHARVASEAVAAGAHLVNDVSGGTMDPHMYSVVADLEVPYIMMHMRGSPATMQQPKNTAYRDACTEVGAELGHRIQNAVAAGIQPWRIITDPGIGFSKQAAENFRLIAGLRRFRYALPAPMQHMPMLVGPSRKRFLGDLLGSQDNAVRDRATAVAASLCIAGSANIIRAHNAAIVREALAVADATYQQS
ncbi:hypothetical protein WJX84_012475 [Apatococcus fuscideae]|uniref:Pterin-binding domain-containing protein n=1 Tax=Apatococcus fuscideae TaxID=2026836 RepID=A0AAW1T9U8_9CHLO